MKAKIDQERSKGTSSGSFMLNITLDLVQDKKTSKWTFWASDGTIKERWIVNFIVETSSNSTRSVNEMRNDMRQLITEASRECLKKSDHLSEGFPNNIHISHKLSNN